MPELPEVEVTRRGLAPHLAGQHHHRRGGARTAAALAGAARRCASSPGAPCAVHPAPRQIPAGRLRRRPPHPAPRHVGKPAPRRRRERPRASTTISTSSFGDQVLRLRDPRRFGAVLWTAAPLEEHPLLAHLGVEPLSRALDAGTAARARRARPRRDQAVPDGRHGASSASATSTRARACSAPASIRASRPAGCRAERMRETGRGDQAHAARGDPRRRLDRCATSSAATAQPGYFQHRALGLRPRRARPAGAAATTISAASCRDSARPTSAPRCQRLAASDFTFAASLARPRDRTNFETSPPSVAISRTSVAEMNMCCSHGVRNTVSKSG